MEIGIAEPAMVRKTKSPKVKPRIPLPRKPPKAERDARKEVSRRRCRLPVKPESNDG